MKKMLTLFLIPALLMNSATHSTSWWTWGKDTTKEVYNSSPKTIDKLINYTILASSGLVLTPTLYKQKNSPSLKGGLLSIASSIGLAYIRKPIIRFIKNNLLDNTPFITAIRENDIDKVISLIKNNAVNDNNTPLHLAMELEDPSIAEVLIENKIGINLKDEEGNTPLHIAVTKNDQEIVKSLIENGAKINLKDKYGRTPLHCAAIRNNREMVNLLIDNGANINLQSNYYGAPLHYAAEDGYLEIVKLLVNANANIKLQNKSGERPLHCAARRNQREIVEFLIKSGTKPNLKDKYGWTALHHAAKMNYPEMVKLLIENGADPYIKDESGTTALHYAKQNKTITGSGNTRRLSFWTYN